MPTCVPIEDMRDTAAFARMVETAPGSVTVTKNGYDQFVVIRSRDYDDLRDSEARARIMERMLLAERERVEGRHVDTAVSLAELRSRYGL